MSDKEPEVLKTQLQYVERGATKASPPLLALRRLNAAVSALFASACRLDSAETVAGTTDGFGYKLCPRVPSSFS